jgi:hypothetical protein
MLDETERRSQESDEPRADRDDPDAGAESAPEPATTHNHEPPRPNGRVRERRSVAGRKGARRIHELIQRGRLYEEEHGLKRGRQRLRQLIEEGKLYEREHALDQGEPPAQRGRIPRMSRHQVMIQLVGALIHLAQPGYRPELNRLLESLTAVRGQGGSAANEAAPPPESASQP